jgi:single-strand DNA-binding protein
MEGKGMNTFCGTGRIANDLELKLSKTGSAILSFSLAVKSIKKGADGKKETLFLRCVAFNKTAENIENYCRKGSLIGVVATVVGNEYVNKEGVKIRNVEFIVDTFEVLDGRKEKDPPPELPIQQEAPQYPYAQNAQKTAYYKGGFQKAGEVVKQLKYEKQARIAPNLPPASVEQDDDDDIDIPF